MTTGISGNYQYGAYPMTYPSYNGYNAQTPSFGSSKTYAAPEEKKSNAAFWVTAFAVTAAAIIFRKKIPGYEKFAKWITKTTGLGAKDVNSVTKWAQDGSSHKIVNVNGEKIIDRTITAQQAAKMKELRKIYNGELAGDKYKAWKELTDMKKAMHTENAQKLAVANAQKALKEGETLTAEQITKIEKEAADGITKKYAKYSDVEKIQKYIESQKGLEEAIASTEKKIAETTDVAAKTALEEKLSGLKKQVTYRDDICKPMLEDAKAAAQKAAETPKDAATV